jgi:hypothetical protein
MKLFYSTFVQRVVSPLLIGLACIIWVPMAFAQEEELSADETAKKLANPAGSLANLANNISFRTYKGDLPGSEDLSAW